MNYTGCGKISVDKNKSIFIKVNNDFVNYYRWLIQKRYFGATGVNTFLNGISKLSTPRLGAHISIVNANLHGWNPEWNKLKLIGQNAYFHYDPQIVYIGGRGFSNFWIPVHSDLINKIKKDLEIKEHKKYLGAHITICSNKGL